MNYVWTERQIKSALTSLMNKSGWLDPHTHFRSFRKNATVRERRDLMRILVERYGAFDNGGSHADKKYCISFDTENKDKLLAEHLPERSLPKRYFPNKKLMFSPIMQNLPPLEVLTGELTNDFEELIERRLKYSDTTIFENTKSDWTVICDMLFTLETDDEYWYLSMPKNIQGTEKDKYYLIAGVAIELFCMYEALESGWVEIQERWESPLPFKNHESCFLEMVKVYSFANLASRYRHIANTVGFNANLKRLKRITASMPDFVNEIIEYDNLKILKKDVRSLSLDLSPTTPKLLNLILTGKGHQFKEILLLSPNPETRIKAARWDDASLSHFKITKRILWRKTR